MNFFLFCITMLEKCSSLKFHSLHLVKNLVFQVKTQIKEGNYNIQSNTIAHYKYQHSAEI